MGVMQNKRHRAARTSLNKPPDHDSEFSDHIAELTVALGDSTRRQIYLHIYQDSKSITTADVAKHFNIHPNVARHHLEKLLQTGFLTIDTTRVREKSGAGRPSKLYRASTKQALHPAPSQKDRLLIELLLATLTGIPTEDAEHLAEEAGVRYGAQLAENAHKTGNAPALSRRDVLHIVAETMNKRGFHISASLEEETLIAQQCPFAEMATKHPQIVCAIDRGMLRGMFDNLLGVASHLSTTSKALGDKTCTAKL